MDTKLTLKLDERVIRKAKKYADKRGRSLSKLVENFFSILAKKEFSEEAELSQSVTDLTGLISLKKDFDQKREYAGYLTRKYNK